MSIYTRNEKPDKNQILELCKEFTWSQSLVSPTDRHNISSPQVALVSEMASYIRQSKGVHYRDIDAHGWLVDFLNDYKHEEYLVPTSRFSRWNYMLIPENEYFHRKNNPNQHHHHQQQQQQQQQLPLITYSLNPKKNDFLFVMFPPTTSGDRVHRSLPQTNRSNNCNFNTYYPSVSSSVSSSYQEGQDNLSIELYDFLKASKRMKVQNQRSNILRKISMMLQDVWPEKKLRLEVFGSSVNGLDFENSDLDLCIVVPKEDYKKDLYNMSRLMNEPFSVYNMRFVESKLRDIGMLNVKAITAATVPICKFNDPVSNICCDINTNNILGIDNSKLVKAYSFLDTRVRPFLYAIKYFVKCRDINESLKGTLSSYTYSLMSLWYLMNCDPPVIPNLQNISQDNSCKAPFCNAKVSLNKWIIFQKRVIECNVAYHNCVNVVHTDRPEYDIEYTSKNSIFTSQETIWKCENVETVGSLLKGFFNYFGREHNFSQYALSLRFGRLIPKWEWKDSHMAVEDPFIIGRNVAGTSTFLGTNTIRNEFKRAYDLLNSNHTFADITGPVDPNERIFDPDTIEQRIIQRNFQQMNRTRRNIGNYDYIHRQSEIVYNELHNPRRRRKPATNLNITKTGYFPQNDREANIPSKLTSTQSSMYYQEPTYSKTSKEDTEIDFEAIASIVEDHTPKKTVVSQYTPIDDNSNTKQKAVDVHNTTTGVKIPRSIIQSSSTNSTDSEETASRLYAKTPPEISRTIQQMFPKMPQEKEVQAGKYQPISNRSPSSTYAEITSPHGAPEALQNLQRPAFQNITPSFSSVVADNIKSPRPIGSGNQQKEIKPAKPAKPARTVKPVETANPVESVKYTKPVKPLNNIINFHDSVNTFKETTYKRVVGFKNKIAPEHPTHLAFTDKPSPKNTTASQIKSPTPTHMSIVNGALKALDPFQFSKTKNKKLFEIPEILEVSDSSVTTNSQYDDSINKEEDCGEGDDDEGGGDTCSLLDVPDFVDAFDILDVLTQYGDVLSLESERLSKPESLYTFLHWRFTINLYQDIDALPKKIELADEYFTIVSK
ncbi:hypothetical protein J3Q64DRAFT_1824285 [Phycomyces blakesleeanus]|uniref:polynucleotide adenylyltransferase n=1 Tax=Phycomyces blakesleeanus TaxID=4837 RepID=A0ABR3AQ20_PHYBL